MQGDSVHFFVSDASFLFAIAVFLAWRFGDRYGRFSARTLRAILWLRFSVQLQNFSFAGRFSALEVHSKGDLVHAKGDFVAANFPRFFLWQ